MYQLIASRTSKDIVREIVVATFFAPDDIASGKIARAMVRTFVASTKTTAFPLTRNMFRLTFNGKLKKEFYRKK